MCYLWFGLQWCCYGTKHWVKSEKKGVNHCGYNVDTLNMWSATRELCNVVVFKNISFTSYTAPLFFV